MTNLEKIIENDGEREFADKNADGWHCKTDQITEWLKEEAENTHGGILEEVSKMTAFIMGTVLGAVLGMIVMALLQGVGDFERFYEEEDDER